MRKNTTKLSAYDLLDLLNAQWATTKDIKLIGCVGQNTAQSIKKEIIEQISADGYKLPSGLVPMENVIRYFNININYLRKVAKVENNV